MTTTRADIQAMRGIAVLAVLAYHARMPFIKGGYLGVDIFFVVSGYLITGLVSRAMRDGHFSFAAFYWRRAWRLLPAAYAVFLACALVSPWLLTIAEQRDFFKQLLGALTFTGNIALWLQTGYFEQAAELKPLLHVWSLAIEEQYYLLLPAAMALIGPRRWRAAALLATLASAAACFALVASKPGDAFYLLPTRAWELGVGSVAALWVARPANLTVLSARWEWVGTLCVAALALLVVTPLQAAHPGWATALACGLTGVVVATGLRWLGVRYGSSALAWFGDRSYSLYLIHWPIFAFLNSAHEGGAWQAWWVRLLAMLVSIALAALLYRYVETPLRVIGHQEVRWLHVLRSVGMTVAIVLIGLVTSVGITDPPDYPTRLRANYGLHVACDQKDDWRDLTECRTDGTGDAVIVWGDSFATHWVAGLQSLGIPLTQWTRSSCPPVTAFAFLAPDGLNEHSARTCLGFNAEVMKQLIERAGQNVVVLAARWNYPDEPMVISATGDSVSVVRSAVVEAFVAQIRALRAVGKRVVLLAPPPLPGFDVGRCIERRDQRLLSFGGTADCIFSLTGARQRGRSSVIFLEAVAALANVAILDPTPVVCDIVTSRCHTEIDGVVIYRDWGHLSYEGSVLLARRMHLDREIARLAR